MISRTAELDDNDVSNNRVHYYLPDAQGGSVGMLLDDDGGCPILAEQGWGTDEPRVSLTFPSIPHPSPAGEGWGTRQTYDAFGNAMSKTFTAAGSFAWRGGEGSVTDRETNLIHMQARHYDPTIGRFIQPDALLMASMTTQGLNRYIYCENDPVNKTDPMGRVAWWVGMLMGVAFFAGLVNGMYDGVTGELSRAQAMQLAAAATTAELAFCELVVPAGVKITELNMFLSSMGLGSSFATAGVAGLLIAASFIAGYVVGYGLGALIAEAAPDYGALDHQDPYEERLIGEPAPGVMDSRVVVRVAAKVGATC